jgi:hypothetical protein
VCVYARLGFMYYVHGPRLQPANVKIWYKVWIAVVLCQISIFPSHTTITRMAPVEGQQANRFPDNAFPRAHLPQPHDRVRQSAGVNTITVFFYSQALTICKLPFRFRMLQAMANSVAIPRISRCQPETFLSMIRHSLRNALRGPLQATMKCTYPARQQR